MSPSVSVPLNTARSEESDEMMPPTDEVSL
jgi:hypothetical protein